MVVSPKVVVRIVEPADGDNGTKGLLPLDVRWNKDTRILTLAASSGAYLSSRLIT
jgi:hypothetical protein